MTGTLTITVTTKKSETPISEAIIIGDADGDGRITVKDVTAIQRHIAEIDIFSGSALMAADVNGDSSVTVDDATCIQLYLAEYDSGFGDCGAIISRTVNV